MTLMNQTCLMPIGAFLVISTLSTCQTRKSESGKQPGEGQLSSIVMTIPQTIQEFVDSGKLDGAYLRIKGQACLDDNDIPTNIEKKAIKLQNGSMLANEKVKKGCSYLLSLSLGKLADKKQSLEKVYFTNVGSETKISEKETAQAKPKIVVKLLVTADGRNELGIQGGVDAPTGDVDIDIDPDIGPDNDNEQNSSLYDWKKEIKMVELTKLSSVTNDFGSAFYRQIHEYDQQSDWHSDVSLSTRAHETLHGLNAMMRNKTKESDQFIYFENGKGAYVLEPEEIYDLIAEYVGKNFRLASLDRFNLYLVNQAKSWKKALYLLDEWSGYVATSRTAVESKKAGKWDNENSDPFTGLTDFVYFGGALLRALEDHDPDYLKSNKQFKAVMAMQVERSIAILEEGAALGAWPNSIGIPHLNMLRKDEENKEIRAAYRRLFGEQWTKEKMGF